MVETENEEITGGGLFAYWLSGKKNKREIAEETNWPKKKRLSFRQRFLSKLKSDPPGPPPDEIPQ